MSENVAHQFRELLKGASEAPPMGTVALTGVVERTPDPNKFGLLLGNGQRVMLEIDSVRSFAELGSLSGQKVVRVDIDAEKRLSPEPLPWVTPAVPFALATQLQAPFSMLAATQGPAFPAWHTGLHDLPTIFGDQKYPYGDRVPPGATGMGGLTTD
jgi:hypothetical protein